MKNFFTNSTSIWKVLPLLCAMFIIGCGDDEDPMTTPGGGGNTDAPIASFQFEVSMDNYQQVTFSNFSQNAVDYEWSFGDGNTSTEESPVHTYASAGTFTVTLKASNADGDSAEKSETVNITDPNSQLTVLAGQESKTWYLLREGVALGVGPAVGDNQWWSFGGITPLAERPCILDDSYTFHRDGTFEFNSNGTLFVDATANGGWIINGEDAEGCRDESDPGVWGDNADREAFANGGDYTYDLDNPNSTLTLNGAGAYIGLCNKTPAGDNTLPIQNKTYTINTLVEGGIADTMNISLAGDGFAWNFYLVSYPNESDLPAIPTEVPVFGEDLPDASPDAMSISFAADDDSERVLLDTIFSLSTVDFAIDDPAGSGEKVGQFNRTGEQFQELQFQTSPDKFDINFENLTTVSLDVYIPSSNDYSGALTTNVIIGFADFSQTAQWWTDNREFVTDGSTIPMDTWTTITYDLNDVNAGAGTYALYDRDDLDMIYINIGGTNHTDTGTFYIRNLSFE